MDKITIKNFPEQVELALETGEESLLRIMQLFEWSVFNKKNICREWPDWSQNVFVEKIQKIFNINPYQYKRVIKQFGGGTSKGQTAKGRAAIKRYGVKETFKAEHELLNKEMDVVREFVEKNPTPEEFNEMVNALVRAKKQKRKQKQIPFKAECKKLKEENITLKKEVRELKKTLEKYQRAASLFESVI